MSGDKTEKKKRRESKVGPAVEDVEMADADADVPKVGCSRVPKVSILILFSQVTEKVENNGSRRACGPVTTSEPSGTEETAEKATQDCEKGCVSCSRILNVINSPVQRQRAGW